MIATALIDSRIQFEIYLIEAVDEANPKFLPIDFPDQALRNSCRQPEPEQASIVAAESVVEPIVRHPQILRHDKGRIDERLGEWCGIEQHLAVIHQRNDIHILRGSGNQPRCVQCRTSAHDQVVSRSSVQSQPAVQELQSFVEVAGEPHVI